MRRKISVCLGLALFICLTVLTIAAQEQEAQLYFVRLVKVKPSKVADYYEGIKELVAQLKEHTYPFPINVFRSNDFCGVYTVPLKDISALQELGNSLNETMAKIEPETGQKIQIPETVSREIKKILDDQEFGTDQDTLFKIDPGHVRRKFYERSVACGFPKEIGSPDLIRKSRAVELMQSNMPLPVVQKILGHSTPNLAASYVAFSDDDIREVAKFYFDRESQRKTSARNTFFGKVSAIRRGDVQVNIEMTTIGGDSVTSVITIDSMKRLGIKTGSLITAEVKAPWVILQKFHKKPNCTAENMFRGKVERITRGKVVTEYVVRISDGTEICSLVTSGNRQRLDLSENDQVWAMFNSFSVVLHVD